MTQFPDIERLSRTTEAILGAPFEWCHVLGGNLSLENASDWGGTSGGEYRINEFAISKYPITNAQYQRFLDEPTGFADAQWWAYSPEAAQWRQNHRYAKSTAFTGADLPRTRVSWFDSLAFCQWLSVQLKSVIGEGCVRLPTEQEWQRAAVGETGWHYPGSAYLRENLGNYGNQVGHPTRIGSYPDGQSPYGVMDMLGNVWEWCLTSWGVDDKAVGGYGYRHIRGGAWNVSNPEYLRATARWGHPPRGRLNDCGFRCVCGGQ